MPFKDIQKKREYAKNHSQDTDRKAAKKAYEQTDKRKAVRKAYNHSGARKAYRKAYAQSDAGKAKGKAYSKAHQSALSAKSRSRPDGHDLYIMQIPNHENWYKVGRAADPHYRAMNLSAGYPWQVNVVEIYGGCGKYEKMVHDKLRPFMVSSENKKETEWFEIAEDELMKQIEDVLIVELFQQS